jgi:hypothetical protein
MRLTSSSQTDKNDHWQGYAAMAAAAYAKDFLLNLPVDQVKMEKPAQETIENTASHHPAGN